MEPAGSADVKSVFLNVPFDTEYSSLFLALIAGLAGLGFKPRCVLEVPSGGRNRLERIFGLIASCDASIHDLSRVALSGDAGVPRFNMPFELGISYSLSQLKSHSFFVLEENGVGELFHPYLFRQLVWTAAKIARSQRLVLQASP